MAAVPSAFAQPAYNFKDRKSRLPDLHRWIVNNHIGLISLQPRHTGRFLFTGNIRQSTWKLLQIELYKIYRRPRTYISFAAHNGVDLRYSTRA